MHAAVCFALTLMPVLVISSTIPGVQKITFERRPFHTIRQSPDHLVHDVATDDSSSYADERYAAAQVPKRVSVLSSASWDIPYRTDCALHCPYGLDTDIEGRVLCQCRDPCKSVQCFGGLKCAPERKCIGLECSFAAVCKADDVCSLRRPKHTFMCEKLSRRYYYDAKKGRCRKFWGCDLIIGNSFGTKKECRQSCENNSVSDYREEDKMKDIEDKDTSRPISLKQTDDEMQHTGYSSLIGLHSWTGCPDDSPFAKCPYDPCERCSSPDMICFTSFCGRCQAVYIDLRTGVLSEKYAKHC